MERMKKIVEEVMIAGACLISIVAIFGNVFEWMLYV